MTGVLSELVAILVGGIQALAKGIAGGLAEMAQALFLKPGATAGTYTNELSAFGGIVAIFAGISLAVGLTTLVTKWIMSLGARN